MRHPNKRRRKPKRKSKKPAGAPQTVSYSDNMVRRARRILIALVAGLLAAIAYYTVSR